MCKDGGAFRNGSDKNETSSSRRIKKNVCKPEFQGIGIGELLLKRIVSESKVFAAKEIYLDSPTPLAHSHKLYQKYVFKIFG